MRLDDSSCYRAFAARDRRFEGRFVTAVTTTRIYCRPGCPAPLPRRQNVRFYACAAAAEEAGFRPCLRCRPDASPGTPAWLGTSATVSRALRLIFEGNLDEAGVDSLAERLGIGARHLRRLFAEQLGASPIAIARTRRVHFARRLLDETELPISEIAFSSGFASIRRFNHAIRETFRRAPRELRSARGRRAEIESEGLELRVPFRSPLDWNGMLAFLSARAIPGVEAVENGAYRRTVEINGASGTLEARVIRGEDSLRLRLRLSAPRDLIQIVERVSRLFDLSADSVTIAAQLRRDPALAAALAGRRGLRVPGAWDPFELAVRAILGQQVSVRGATTLAGRIASAFGEPLTNGSLGPRPNGSLELRANDRLEPLASASLTRLFPRPKALAQANLTGIGLPRARAAAIRSLAAAVSDGALDFSALGGLEDAVARLSALPGIGEWTAQYVAMRALGEPDAFPAGDLGLRHALAARAEAWRPWRAYAVMALWTQPLKPTPKRRSKS